jgi:hypothetical protein
MAPETNDRLMGMAPPEPASYRWLILLRWVIEREVGWQHAPAWAQACRTQAEKARVAHLEEGLRISQLDPLARPFIEAPGGAAGLLQIAQTEARTIPPSPTRAPLTRIRLSGSEVEQSTGTGFNCSCFWNPIKAGGMWP